MTNKDGWFILFKRRFICVLKNVEGCMFMEFSEKLQKLRKEKGLTQEELAERLYVSRTAVSKWESGRGYPNLDSLKDIARFFKISIDELLSGEELLTAAEMESRKKINDFRGVLFGLLDLSVILLLVLPFFAQRIEGEIFEVSLLQLTEISLYLKIAYFCLVGGMVGCGVLMLLFSGGQLAGWRTYKYRISLIGSGLGVLAFTISLQPYAAVLLFVFLAIKSLMLIKW